MGFNLDNYEPVKVRKKRFYGDYPDGRIIPVMTFRDEKTCVIKTTLYKSGQELADGLPLACGYAEETKGVGGMANKFAWTENCEESSIGRALDNAGYATDEKCSREEMIKVAQKEKEIIELKDQLRRVIKDLDDQSLVDFQKSIGIKNLSEVANFGLDELRSAIEVLGE